MFTHKIDPHLIGFFFITALKCWLEKEDSQDGKHDEELDKDDCPKGAPDGHLLEAFIVESCYALDNVLFHADVLVCGKYMLNF